MFKRGYIQRNVYEIYMSPGAAEGIEAAARRFGSLGAVVTRRRRHGATAAPRHRLPCAGYSRKPGLA